MNPAHLQNHPRPFPHALLNEPVLIADGKRGVVECFLLEHRQPSEFPPALDPAEPGEPKIQIAL